MKRRGLLAHSLPDADLTYSTPNKRAVRLTVRIKSSDPLLVDWMKWGPKNLESREWFDRLNQAGGGMAKAKTWYIVFRPIAVSEITAIDVLDPDPDVSPLGAADYLTMTPDDERHIRGE